VLVLVEVLPGHVTGVAAEESGQCGLGRRRDLHAVSLLLVGHPGCGRAASVSRRTSTQSPSMVSVASSCARVRPRLTTATGVPVDTARRTKRYPERTVRDEPMTTTTSDSSTSALA